MFQLLLLGFLLGVAATVATALFILVHLLGYQGPSLPDVHTHREQFSEPSHRLTRDEKSNNERISGAVNNLIAFYFQEMKNSDTIRNWANRKVQDELTDLKKKNAIRFFAKDIKLLSYDLGMSLPLVTIDSSTNTFSKGHTVLEETEIIVDVDYTGGAYVEMELSLSFDKNLVVMCKLVRLLGKARLKFSRIPFTHWSFSFIQEPVIELNISSNLDGRRIPKIVIPIIANQIRRAIRRRHTLPNYRMRVRPFFGTAVYTSAQATTSGQSDISAHTLVTVVQADRLVLDTENSQFLYCLLVTGQHMYVPKPPKKTDVVTLNLRQSELCGNIQFSEKMLPNYQKRIVCVTKVRNKFFNIIKGDVLEGIDGIQIITADQANSLLRNLRQEWLTLTLRRVRVNAANMKSASSESALTNLSSNNTLVESASTNKSLQKSEVLPIPAPSYTSHVNCKDLKKSAHHETTSVQSKTRAIFNERLEVDFQESHIFLNVCLMSRNRDNSESLVGFASVSIYDIMAKCQATAQGDTLLKVSLNAPPDLLHINQLNPGARCLEPNRCFGDVTLRFALSNLKMMPSQVSDDPSVEPFVDIDMNGEVLGDVSTESEHVFRITGFEHSIVCDFCLKKIWMKKALYCEKCNVVCHQKCMSLCMRAIPCSSGKYKPLHERPIPPPSIREGLMNKLRRRKANTDSQDGGAVNLSSSPPGAHGVQFTEKDEAESYFLSSSDEENDEFDALGSCQGTGRRDQNEEEILLFAREKGKELLAGLNPTERKAQLEEKIDQFQTEIEMVSKVRDDIEKSLRTVNPTQRKALENKLNKTSDKIQSLVVLLLQYCSGLQDCEESLSEAFSSSNQSSSSIPDPRKRKEGSGMTTDWQHISM